MALPTLAKTWNITANQAYNYQGSTLSCARNAVMQMFTWLKNSGWTVRSSSDGTTASATDRWTDVSKLNWNTSNRSWVVLRNTSLGSTYDLCIDLVSNNSTNLWSGNLTLVIAKGGYAITSLVTTARPALATVGDAEQTIFSPGSSDWMWFGGSNADQAIVMNFWAASDNTAYRMAVYNQDYLSFFLMIEKAGNASSVWTTASPDSQVITWAGSRQNYASNIDIGGIYWSSGVGTRIGNISTALRTSVESWSGGWITQGVVNDQTGEYPMLPMGLVCVSAPYRMRVGNINDMWHTQISLPNGTTFPSDGSKQFLQLGAVIVPWGTAGSPGPILRTRY